MNSEKGPGIVNDVTRMFSIGQLKYHELKNNCSLFERLFKLKKNGVFLFEIFTFLYYANEESDDIIDDSTKTAQHSIKNNSRNIKAVFFKLGTSNVHQKRNIMTPIVPLP